MMASLVVKKGWSTYKKRTRNKQGRNPVWSFFFSLVPARYIESDQRSFQTEDLRPPICPEQMHTLLHAF